MKFLVISDLHGNLNVLDKIAEEVKKTDGVLFAGDFAEFNKPETGLPALEKLCKICDDNIMSVLGNCDDPSFIDELEKRDVCIQGSLITKDGLAFAGSGGGSKFTGTTPFERTDEELVSDFKIITEQGTQKWDNMIAIMHNPPKDTKCDTISNGMHVGSPLLKQFIEEYEPLAVITGHIHESAAVDTVGNTTIINPGSLSEGKYAILTVSKTKSEWHVDSAELKNL